MWNGWSLEYTAGAMVVTDLNRALKCGMGRQQKERVSSTVGSGCKVGLSLYRENTNSLG